MILAVTLTTAMACVQLDCVPVIVGKSKTPTPVGVFSSPYYATTNQYGYGGEIIVFKENNTMVWAIHRPYTSPSKKNYRANLLYNSTSAQRHISNGCVNVPSEFFEKYKHLITQVVVEQ